MGKLNSLMFLIVFIHAVGNIFSLNIFVPERKDLFLVGSFSVAIALA